VEVCDGDVSDERRVVAGVCGRDRDRDWRSSIAVIVVVLLLADAVAAMIVFRLRMDLRSLCSLVQ